jgi:hypothetical protein
LFIYCPKQNEISLKPKYVFEKIFLNLLGIFVEVPDENAQSCAAHKTSLFADIETKNRRKINRPTTIDLVHNVEDYFSPLHRRRWEPNCYTGKEGGFTIPRILCSNR